MRKIQTIYTVLWALILALGAQMYFGLILENVEGYPNSMQFATIIILPFTFFFMNFLGAIFLTKRPLFADILSFICQMVGLFLFVFLSFS